MGSAEAPNLEPGQPEPESWSVIAGQFDPNRTLVNEVTVALTVDAHFYLPRGSEGKRKVQAIELVLKAIELNGYDSSLARQAVTKKVIDLTDWQAQVELVDRTPELDHPADTSAADKSNPSPAMTALRVLIDESNETDSLVVHDHLITDRSIWQVDGDTRRLAEAAVRALYLQEQQTRN